MTPFADPRLDRAYHESSGGSMITILWFGFEKMLDDN